MAAPAAAYTDRRGALPATSAPRLLLCPTVLDQGGLKTRPNEACAVCHALPCARAGNDLTMMAVQGPLAAAGPALVQAINEPLLALQGLVEPAAAAAPLVASTVTDPLK